MGCVAQLVERRETNIMPECTRVVQTTGGRRFESDRISLFKPSRAKPEQGGGIDPEPRSGGKRE